ncbi:hypothetical protein RJT34_22034 [Clitoria ternatea]|uniref:RNase H type-1 domain-containing protein n=1 Tax=Clitoria ternatea TaxID=43366 RepID=A0AAN9IUX8_CLITE
MESDNLSLIKSYRKEIQVLEILPIVKDIQQLRDQFQAIGFTWTRRADNEAAHMVAKLDQENNLASRWWLHRPQLLRKILTEDKRKIPPSIRLVPPPGRETSSWEVKRKTFPWSKRGEKVRSLLTNKELWIISPTVCVRTFSKEKL